MNRIVVAALLFAPTVAYAGWFSYDNYEDCMLGRMKGQAQSMYLTADKLCKKEFKIEHSLYSSSVKWNFKTERGETIVTIEDAGEYEVTSGTFAFSEKPCSDSKPEDFRSPAKIKFVGGVAKYTFSMSTMRCANGLELEGRYK